MIPRSIKLGEAPGFGMPIILYDKNSHGARSYYEFAKEFLGVDFPIEIETKEKKESEDGEESIRQRA